MNARNALRFTAVVACLCWLLAPSTTTAQAAPPARGKAHRFALVVGVNDGGETRMPLRYAARDANAFADVMVQLGGIEPGDTMRLERADISLLRVSLQAMSRRVSEARARGDHTEFMLFYSGHSDEEGLRVGGELMTYAELRSLVTSVDADVRIAVLDSCASGTLTRLKGGRRRAPFLFDLSSDVRGHAFLTSASGDEAAQESDRIQASFFTHYLVSGLRGAADFNGDGRVTLNEAYRFAFDETLARTERTQAGAQHPAYDIQLVGTGDLVMTDLRATGANLGLPGELEGRFFIRDDQGRLVAELSKPAGRDIELSLPPGAYTVAIDARGGRSEGRVQLGPASTYALEPGDLQAVEMETTRTRGNAQPASTAAASGPATVADDENPEDVEHGEGHEGGEGDDDKADDVKVVPFAFSVFSPLDSNQPAREAGVRIQNETQFNLLWGRTDILDGVQMGGGNHTDERMHGVQLGYAVNSAFGDVEGVQIAGLANLRDGDSYANVVQLGIGLNVLSGAGRGVQVSGAVNAASGAMEGVQVGGGLNVNGGALQGVQVAGGFNYAGNLRGVQVAPLNVVASGKELVQVGVVNVTGGHSDEAAQVGVANIHGSAMRGAQVGVFNYAERATAQVGVISVTPDAHAQLWTSNAGVLMASLRFDADYTYSLISMGSSFAEGGDLLAGIGLGVKTPPIQEHLFIEFDASAYAVAAPDIAAQYTPTLTQLRLTGRLEVTPFVHVFSGLTLNAYWSHAEQLADRERPGYGPATDTVTDGNYTHEVWPGFVLGVGL